MDADVARVARRWTTRLTHHGRKSGRPYQVTIWFLAEPREPRTIYLCTMKMRRQWPQNVKAHPEVELAIGDTTFRGTARHVTDAEWPRVVELLRKKYWSSIPYLLLRGRPEGAFRVELAPAAG